VDDKPEAAPSGAGAAGRRAVLIESAVVLAAAFLATRIVFGAGLSDLWNQSITQPRGGADTHLIAWVLSWDTHALTSAPLRLFEANILHPAHNTLAAAEHMLGYVPLFAPAYWLTGNPVFALNWTLWASFALSGAALYALLRHWGCSRAAAGFAGLVMIASPGKLDRAFMMQSIGWFYLPIAIIFFDRMIDRRRIGDAAAFGLLVGMQMLCSFYLAFIALGLLAAYALALAPWNAGRGGGFVQLLSRVAVAGMVAAIVFIPTALPYVSQISGGRIREHGQSDWLQTMTHRTWAEYLYSPAVFDLPVLHQGYYLGLLPFLFAVAALALRVPGDPLRRRRAFGILLGLLLCGVLAAGRHGNFEGVWLPPLYEWFLSVPGFASMRAPARFALGVVFATTALAGLGLHAIQTRTRAGNAITAVAVAAAVGLTWLDFGFLDRSFSRLRLPSGSSVPPVYRALTELERGPVLEIPAGIERGIRQQRVESLYSFLSTYHWQPILNGYTGYIPLTTGELMRIVQALPDGRALRMLQRLSGVRYVVVHDDRLRPAERRSWEAPAGLTLIDRFGSDRLYEVEEPIAADLIPGLLDPDLGSGTTLTGTSLAPLASQAAEIRFVGEAPSAASTRLTRAINVEVRNPGPDSWPGLAPYDDRRVFFAVRWQSLANPGPAPTVERIPLPFDRAAGESLRTTLHPRAPRFDGEYQLTVGLIQGDRHLDGAAVASPVSVQRIRARRKRRPRG